MNAFLHVKIKASQATLLKMGVDIDGARILTSGKVFPVEKRRMSDRGRTALLLSCPEYPRKEFWVYKEAVEYV